MALRSSFFVDHQTLPLRARVIVVALILGLHVAIGVVWFLQPEQPVIVVNEMPVFMAMQQAQVAQPILEPSKPQPKVDPSVQPVRKPVVREVADVAPMPLAAPPIAAPVAASPAPVVATPTVADTEPDYKAGYLHNVRPAYPMVARKMGWEGKVILNVEVLAEGACGAISVFSSSGRDVLDNAAIHAVKGWHFSPARHGGQTVTKWFKVPINFSLEDSEV